MTTRTPKRTKSSPSITETSGNVFAGLGLAHPEHELLKARLTLQICRTIKERKLTQTQAGDIFGIKQPRVSGLMRGHSGAFSVERLMDVLTRLATKSKSQSPPHAKSTATCLSFSVDDLNRLF